MCRRSPRGDGREVHWRGALALLFFVVTPPCDAAEKVWDGSGRSNLWTDNANWAGLTSGTLQHAINIQEDGTPPPGAAVYEVWTGTRSNGTYSGNACANWTNDTAMSPTGDVGVSSVTNLGWTNIYQQFCDRTTIHVYCFEQ